MPEETKVPGSLAGGGDALTVGGTYGSFALFDDLEVSFLLRATQAHSDALSLSAPKVTVLSGESASLSVQSQVSYAMPPTTAYTSSYSGYGMGGGGGSMISTSVNYVQVGTNLTITPTITPDKKHVLLDITAGLIDLLRLKTHSVEGPVGEEGEVQEYTVVVPETETSEVKTRVSVPDGGTLLLGGLKVSAEVEKEAGVPILSKIPIIQRLFSNRTKVKDQKILLILVKPTIILQEEADAEAIAAIEGVF